MQFPVGSIEEAFVKLAVNIESNMGALGSENGSPQLVSSAQTSNVSVVLCTDVDLRHER